MQRILNIPCVLCLPGYLQGQYNTTANMTTLAIQHSPLGQEQLARGPVAVGEAEGSREPLALLTEPCREAGWGSPAQQVPGHAAQGGQQQDTSDGQHSHKPGWRVPHCLCLHDNQRLLLQRLWRQWGEGPWEVQGSLEHLLISGLCSPCAGWWCWAAPGCSGG